MKKFFYSLMFGAAILAYLDSLNKIVYEERAD